MSLLHATWLKHNENFPHPRCAGLFLWADTWKVATPTEHKFEPSSHPYSLNTKELKNAIKMIMKNKRKIKSNFYKRKSLNYIKKNYDWKKISNIYVQNYKKLLDN